jgi:hypothetical protein
MMVVRVKVKSCLLGLSAISSKQNFHYFYGMTTATLTKEINKLPLTEQLLIAEGVLRCIRIKMRAKNKDVVDVLHDNYVTNKKLTIFTILDTEPFYEM